jgi:hypothetical protein
MKSGPATVAAMALEKSAAAIYAQAYRESLSHERILELRKSRIYDHPDYRRIGSYNCGRIEGVLHGCADLVHMTGLVRWQLYLDGARITSAEISPGSKDDEDRLARWSRVVGRHEWAHTGEPYDDFAEVRKVA